MADTEIAEALNGAVAAVGKELHAENGAAKHLPGVPITYKTVKPHLIIQAPKAAEALVFYKKAFGAEEVEKVYAPKRKAEQQEPLIRHAHIRFGEAEIFVCDFPEDGTPTELVPEALKCPSMLLHLITSDADAAAAKAVEAGATVRMEVADQFWGERYGQVVDPYGYTWGLSGPLAKGAEVLAEGPVGVEQAVA